MRILSRIPVRAIVFSTLLVLPGSAAAEPVTITNGFVDVSSALMARFHLRFEGADFFLDVRGEPFVSTAGMECFPCEPGTVLDLGGTFLGPMASGTATVNGVTYPQVWVDGMTATFTTPSITLAGGATTVVAVPFTFSGTIVAFPENPFTRFPDVPSLFATSVVGRGTATGTFLHNQDQQSPLFSASSLRYDFTTAEPVPEPASMVLCGVGAAVLAFRRRRRTSDSC